MPILTPQERIGTELDGRYRITEILGEGGMGVVFAGEHTGTGRAVAIKLLRPDFASSDVAAERFLREARAAGNIEHENVVNVLDVGRDPSDGSLFLVLERLRGQDLSVRLEAGPLSMEEAAPIFVPVMDALAEAHELGIIHRDLKPENIFLHTGRKGRVVAKLVDFGIAKVTDDKIGRGTRTGTVVGTPWYMSPEQAAGDKSLGPSSDVWSIAVVFYEAVTGELPYDAPNIQALFAKLMTSKPRPLSEVAPWISAAISDWIDRSLSLDPKERPTMRALADGLEQVFASSGIAVEGLASVDRALLSASSGSLPIPADTGPIPSAPPGLGRGSARARSVAEADTVTPKSWERAAGSVPETLELLRDDDSGPEEEPGAAPEAAEPAEAAPPREVAPAPEEPSAAAVLAASEAPPQGAPPSYRWAVVAAALGLVTLIGLGFVLLPGGEEPPGDEGAAGLATSPVREGAERLAPVGTEIPPPAPRSAPVEASSASGAAASRRSAEADEEDSAQARANEVRTEDPSADEENSESADAVAVAGRPVARTERTAEPQPAEEEPSSRPARAGARSGASGHAHPPEGSPPEATSGAGTRQEPARGGGRSGTSGRAPRGAEVGRNDALIFD